MMFAVGSACISCTGSGYSMPGQYHIAYKLPVMIIDPGEHKILSPPSWRPIESIRIKR